MSLEMDLTCPNGRWTKNGIYYIWSKTPFDRKRIYANPSSYPNPNSNPN